MGILKRIGKNICKLETYTILLYFLILVIVLCLGTSVEKQLLKKLETIKREHCVYNDYISDFVAFFLILRCLR